MIKRVIIITCIILTLMGCSRLTGIPSMSQFALNTVCTITLFDEGEIQIYREIFTRIREIEEKMSLFIVESEINLINNSAGLNPVRVSEEVFAVVERALYFAELSNGAFDPTVGPLVKLWDIGADEPVPPSREEIDAILPLINWRNVDLDHINQTIFLNSPGMALDLGAISKGYAADEAASIIRGAGLPQAIVNLGGNIMTIGEKPDGTLWLVGIQNPLEEIWDYLGILETGEKTIVTSGLYERYFYFEEEFYHHIFSPTTGYPAQSGLLSVTIITDKSMDADALSTAVFVLGYSEGRALVESLTGVEAIFILEDRTIRHTAGVDFTLTDFYFTLINN
ncbi:MAG: FAD:protein FMN transferase [Treponema sp.]|nr:FAD:protein FMN transferase [Treponema sp.]